MMAEMVGSNALGWKPFFICRVPRQFSDIGQQLTAVGDNIWIVPCLCASRDNHHNVMRGEETPAARGADPFIHFCLSYARHPL